MTMYRIQAVSTQSELVEIILFKVTRAIEKRFTHPGEPPFCPQPKQPWVFCIQLPQS